MDSSAFVPIGGVHHRLGSLGGGGGLIPDIVLRAGGGRGGGLVVVVGLVRGVVAGVGVGDDVRVVGRTAAVG